MLRSIRACSAGRTWLCGRLSLLTYARWVMVVAAVVLACLVPATVAGLGYLVPTLAGLFRRREPSCVPTHTFAILIPAHNEEHTLPAALQSLAVLDYPAEMVRVCVVADNCTDETASIARAAGAECLVRTDLVQRGKGYALAFGLESVLKDAPDVVLILDADCTLNPDALLALDAEFTAGAVVAQGAVRSRNADDGPAGLVAAVGAAFDDATAAGWDWLGFAVPLRGTGMALRREVLEQIPWTAYGLVEDAEYAIRLKRAGVRVRYCDGAEVTSDAPPSVADLCQQRRRWARSRFARQQASGVSPSGDYARRELRVWLRAVARRARNALWNALPASCGCGGSYAKAVVVSSARPGSGVAA